MSARLEGFDELAAKLLKMQKLEPLKVGMKAGAVYLKGKASEYPPRRSGIRANFVSDRQRRGFFAKLRAGQIEVPYRRGSSPGSQRHGQSWTIKAEDGGLTQVIGSDTAYGPLLQDEQQQTRMHKLTGWKTTKRIIAHEGPKARRLVARELSKWVRS